MTRARIFQCSQYAGVAALVLSAIWILWTELRPPAIAANQSRHSVAITRTALPGTGQTIGPFRLTSAVALSSPDKAFGGLSGLAALPDGQLLAVTDAGDWLLLHADGQTGEMGSIVMPGSEKADRDAEAIAFTPDGHTLVSLEQQHRVLRFAGHGPPLTPAGDPLYRTDTMAWPPNGGGESLAVLGDGSLIWIAEDAPTADGALTALLVAPDGHTRRLLIDAVDGFRPTDAVLWDDNHLLLLHRRYTGAETAAAISIVDLAPVLAGGSAAPARLLARWGRGEKWPIDNMEGIALARRAGQPPLLYLVSDDNFSAAQATILLRLEIISPLVASGQ
ncbi:esterase-like activity of phytase family protein [Sandarakinorhabdus sp. AAP62]|uniref:esterase-like activity of phytase family protein n=1 Tax=Sandarakinorhabdus sp. AAP62 TaxID=1248916 RepID=UPI000307302C|nr:esterase-like activity of phytase family protein [Sandarakinorhabdus sp. AAP62]